MTTYHNFTKACTWLLHRQFLHISLPLFFLAAITFTSCNMAGKPPKMPLNPRTEYQITPLGLDEEQPRFSWYVNDESRGAEQSAYQILVASAPENLTEEKADVWNSGKTLSDQSVNVAYAGKALTPKTRYYWTIRTWDLNDQPSPFSEETWWETGLLTQENSIPGATWISARETGYPLRSVMMRKGFTVDGNITSARLYVTGLGNYTFYLNGKKVGDDLLTPGWTDYPQKLQYQVYDVTGQLKKEGNAMGAMLGNMWWSSGLGWKGGAYYSDGPLKLIASLDITLDNGEKLQISTDSTWKFDESPIVENTIYHGVTWNAQLEQPGWAEAGFDDESWKAVQAPAPHPARLIAQIGPPIQVTETIKPVSISEPRPGHYVFDFGLNMVGWAKLQLDTAVAGKTVTMRFAELLHENGTVAQENLRSARATDRYTMKGEAPETFEPLFTYHGFRYIEVTGLPKAPDENTLTGIVFHSNAPVTGSFSCSNELINQIQRNILRGQRGNLHSVPTDCPQRDERLGWMGDAQIFAPTASYNMQMAPFFYKWVRDIVDSQDESGYVYDVNPAIVVGGPSKPGWGDAIVVVPWIVYKFYGDKRIIEDNYEAMAAWVEYMASKSEDDLYIWRDPNRPDWFGYGDWIAPEKSPGQPIGAAYYFYCSKLMSEMARAIGKDEDAGMYEQKMKDIYTAFHKEFFNDTTNNYEGGTQTANLLPVAFELAPAAKRDSIMANVARNVIDRGVHPSTGFLGTGYILPMLSDFGYHDLAYQVATQTEYPSWGYMVKNGATSIWELWNSDTEPPEGMNSRNHFALGAIGDWFYGYLGGLKPDPEYPGFKRSIIAPKPAGDLTFANVTYESEYGTIVTGWKLEENTFQLDVTLPPNTSALVVLPTKSIKSPTVISSEKEIVSEGKRGKSVTGVQFLDVEEGEVVLEVGAGSYRFSVPMNE